MTQGSTAIPIPRKLGVFLSFCAGCISMLHALFMLGHVVTAEAMDLNIHLIWSSNQTPVDCYRNLSDCFLNTRILCFVQVCMQHLQWKDI